MTFSRVFYLDRLKPFWRALRDNPVAVKELRARMRGARAFVVLTVYLGLMSGFAALLYAAYAASASGPYGPGPQIIGKAVFGGVVGLELFLVCFISPAFTAGTISSERERQTYDLLRTTLLPAHSLVLGKLFAALSYILLLLLAALPLQSLAFLLGGVAPAEVVISLVVLSVTALAFASMGLFASSIMKRTLGASVVAYVFALLTTLGLPLILMTLLPLADLYMYSSATSASQSAIDQAALLVAGFLLVSINPIATAVATEIVLVEMHSAFLFTLPLDNNSTLTLVSPWIVYTLFYLVFSIALIVLSVHWVRRVER